MLRHAPLVVLLVLAALLCLESRRPTRVTEARAVAQNRAGHQGAAADLAPPDSEFDSECLWAALAGLEDANLSGPIAEEGLQPEARPIRCGNHFATGSSPGSGRSEQSRTEVSLRGPDDVPDKRMHVTEGPVTSAAYNTGSRLYEGEQIEVGDGWVRHGAWRAWHPDGKPWEEGSYREGAEDGPWRWWYESGEPQAVGTYADGTQVGGWTYYHETGYVMAEGVYDDGRPVGLWRTYHEDGVLHSEGRFEHGQRAGPWRVQRADGTLDVEISGFYRAGERVGE